MQKNGDASGTHCMYMHLISPRWEIAYSWILLCYIKSVFGLDSILAGIIIAFDVSLLDWFMNVSLLDWFMNVSLLDWFMSFS